MSDSERYKPTKEELKIRLEQENKAIKDSKHETFTLEEMLEIAQYGFELAKTSQETYVPVGNMLQHLMMKRGNILVPDAWNDFREEMSKRWDSEKQQYKL
jgi:hypothetical protein